MARDVHEARRHHRRRPRTASTTRSTPRRSTLKAFSHPTATDFAKHRDAWVKYLKERQLTEKLGWKPEDKQYGGWGYCRVIPKKPEPNEFAPP